jgi:hypothetical protein
LVTERHKFHGYAGGIFLGSFLSDISDTPPDDVAQLQDAVFSRKTSQVYDYTEVDRGKKVFYTACYEHAKGEHGSWSDIIETLIP